MKTKSLKKISTLMAAGIFSLCQMQGQTTGLSGTGANTQNAGTAGTDNTSIGAYAGYSLNTHTTANVFLGKQAGYYIAGASGYSIGNNTFLGFRAGYTSGNGDTEYICNANTFVGSNSGYSNVSGGLNVFSGYYSGYANTSGSYNSVYGTESCRYNQGGEHNSVYGYRAGFGNGSVNSYYQNSFFGSKCGYGVTTGGGNTAMGYETMYSLTTGGSNSVIGAGAMNGNTTGSYNTAIGNYAGAANTTGSSNTCVGYAAGAGYTTGSNNTFVGYGADANANNYSNATAIGNGAVTTANNRMYLGNANALIYSALGDWSGSDGRFKSNIKEDVKGLDFINKLRPVTYQFDTKMLTEHVTKNMPDSIRVKYIDGVDFTESKNVVRSGFIAQEVEQAAIVTGYVSDIVQAPKSDVDHYALNYAEMVVPLVKAVQELSRMAETQDSLINALRAQVTACCAAGKGLKQKNQTGSNGTGSSLTGEQLSNTMIGNDALNNAPANGVLIQNNPNPFTRETNIQYFVPTTTQNASLMIFDLQGKLVKTTPVTNFGNGNVTVNANELSAGMFVYTLVVDGKIVDTKRMILTQ